MRLVIGENMMANANLLAILVAAATGFLIGGLWYGPLFGKKWMAEHGFTEEQLRSSNMLKIYGLTFAFSVLSAMFLGHLLAFFDTNTRSTLMISVGVSLG
jgi:cytochrome b subunit of formate dehydrogenase